jgi:hypothetical protein
MPEDMEIIRKIEEQLGIELKPLPIKAIMSFRNKGETTLYHLLVEM